MRPADVDKIIGDATELAVKQQVSDFFNDKNLVKQDEYCVVDFIGDKSAYEVKTVQFQYGDYDYVLVTTEKLKRYAKQYTKDLYIIYKFKDESIYYIKYDAEKFASYQIRDVKRKDREYKSARPCHHIFIPLADLQPIKKKVNRCLIDFGV